MNITWSQRIFEELHSEGVRDVVFCAGARNGPLVAVLAKTTGFELHSFFEERSAAFFAMGIARRTGRPVAVVTTSGTAAAELLPAVIEAYHTGVPLIVMTADRPRRLRGTGAPQAIDQTGLYAKFVAREFDLESGEMFSLADWHRRAPVHLNICFDEPLLDKPVESFHLADHAVEPRGVTPFAGRSSFAVSAGAEWGSLRLQKFLKAPGPLLVIVGTLETAQEKESVKGLLLQLGTPVYLEATSGLRECAELQNVALRSGDRLLAWALKHQLIGRVLRIGGVPTVRIWRDLEEPTSSVDVLSLTSLPFSGLSRGEMVCGEIPEIVRATQVQPVQRSNGVSSSETPSSALFAKDREVESELEALFRSEPNAEPSLVHALSRLIPSHAKIYVGNSLPIREWDLAAIRGSERHVEANRGVNGIDGQLSTFFGLAENGRENWAFLGDLTALYDLTGPWALQSRPDLNARIVVMNNGGGKIFNRIFRNSLFENRHGLDFEHWARMWKLGYSRWTEIPASFDGEAVEVIEIVPDDEATRRFWDRYDNLW